LTFTPVATTYLPLVTRNSGFDKWALWTGSTQLRGANIYQRRVYPDLDDGMLGYGPVGPPYTQADFDQLAALGANYVNISHPGLFTETAPYAVDLDVQNNLDNLLNMISNAGMFAVISFRTGPGRSEFSVCCFEEAGDWYPASYLNDQVWEEQAAQDGWAAMWRYTAERYRDNPIVVGYDLMVEPNANEVVPGDWLDPEDFYAQYGGKLADWNQLYPDITAAIREVDVQTPILIGGMGYSGVDWLPYLQPTTDPRTVYLVHQYEPFDYTHQEPGAGVGYPSGSFDRDDLDDLLSTIDNFKITHGVPVAVNEFGVQRWAPGADVFMDDQMDLFEQRELNHALWVWDPLYAPWTEEVNSFNFRFGPNPDNDSPVPNALMNVIVKYWGRN
jgi:aryl-phospho-beta-D-glucosidase BglC (GH1 family)